MRLLGALVAALGLAAAGGPPAAAQSWLIGAPGYTAESVAVEIESETIGRFGEPRNGPIRFIGGLKLSSGSKAFGGFSALMIEDDGRRLVAVSDAGTWLTADLVYAGGRLAGLRNATMAPLLDDQGKTLGKTRRNAEGMARLANGDVLVSFERRSVMLRRYAFGREGVNAHGRIATPFRSMRSLSGNAGMEAVSMCPDQRFVAVGEAVKKGKAQGWIWRTGGSADHFEVSVSDDFAVTDAVCLGSEVVLLERRGMSLRSFSFAAALRLAVRLRRLSLEDLANGGAGETLIEAGLSYNIDNFEGLAVHERAGRKILTLISDDNFNFIQSTLLLQFELR